MRWVKALSNVLSMQRGEASKDIYGQLVDAYELIAYPYIWTVPGIGKIEGVVKSKPLGNKVVLDLIFT